MKKMQVLIGIFLLSLIGLQQNCSDVTLTQSSELSVGYATGSAVLCLDQTLSSYTIDKTVAMNLNLLYKDKGVVVDSDADGISDYDEVKYGFNPKLSRSDGVHLDRICLDLKGGPNCSGLANGCSVTATMLGLTSCDLQSLGLDLYPHPSKGLDTDKDGMPDLLEIRLGMQPNQADSLDDPDHDLKTNIDEISSGSNPYVHDQPQRKKYATVLRTSRLPASNSCAGELWQVDLIQLPYYPLPGFTSDFDSYTGPSHSLTLSRPDGTNIGLLYVKLTPKPGSAAVNSKVIFSRFTIGKNSGTLSLSTSNFVDAGDVLP